MKEFHEEHCKSGEHHHCCEKMHQKFHEEHCCKDKFMKFAAEAWKELLKEKIKANIEKEYGPHMDQLAEILAKGNADVWKHKMQAKMCYEDYQNKVKELFKSTK